MACKRQLGFHNQWSTGYNARVWVQLPIVPDAPQCRLASRSGDTLRTLGGIARVVSLEPGATVPVFNLDVAGARTFFVGMKDALVHDNTLPNSHLEPFDAAKTQDLHDG